MGAHRRDHLAALGNGLGSPPHGGDDLAHLASQAFDPGANVLGRPTGLVGKVLDLGSHDRKTLSGVTGAGGFDRRVQGQQIGLLGDVLDLRDDLADPFGFLSQGIHFRGGGIHRLHDLLHRRNGLRGGRDAPTRGIVGAVCVLGCVLAGFGDLPDGSHQFLDRCGHRLRLLLGLVDFLAHTNELDHRFVAANAGADHPMQHGQHDLEAFLAFLFLEAGLLAFQPNVLCYVVLEDVDRVGHLADLVAPVSAGYVDIDVSGRQPFHRVGNRAKRLGDAAADQAGGAADDDRCGESEGDHHEEVIEEQRIDVVDIDTGADDPSPGGEALDVGNLGPCRLAVRRLEIVGHEPGARVLDG